MKNKELLKNFIIYGIGFGLSKFSIILLLPLVTSALSPDDFGRIEIIQTIYNILIVFGLLQLDSSFQRYYDDPSIDRKILISTTHTSILYVNSILFTLINLVGFVLDYTNVTNINYNTFLILSIWIFFSNISTFYYLIYRYENRSIVLSIFTLIQVFIQAFLIWFFLIHIGKSVIYYFVAQAISFIILVILQIIFVNMKISFQFKFDYLRKLIFFGLPQLPARIGSVFNQNVSRFFILNYLGSYSLGLFSAALKIASLSQMLYLAFNMAWYPFLYKKINNNNFTELKKINTIVVLIVSALSIIITIYSKLLVNILLSSEYFTSSQYIGPLFTSFVLIIIKDTIDIGVKVKESTKYVSYIYFISLIISVLVYYLFSENGLLEVVCIQFFSNYIILLLTLINSESLFKIGFSFYINLIVPLFVFIVVLYLSKLTLSVITIFILTMIVISSTLLMIFFLVTKVKV